MVIVHGIVGGEEHRVGVHYVDKHLVTRRHRAGVVVKVAGKAQAHLGGLGNIDIHVGTHGVDLAVNVVVEAVAVVHLQDTAILGEGSRYIIGSHLTTTSDRHIGTGALCGVLEQHVVPVVGRVDDAVGTRLARVLYLVLAVDEVVNVAGIARQQGLVVTLHVGYGVGYLHLLGRT